MYPLTTPIYSSAYPSPICSPTGPLIHLCVPFAPKPPLLPPCHLHTYASLCPLSVCISVRPSLSYSYSATHPSSIYPPTPIHPSTTHPFTHHPFHPPICSSLYIHPFAHLLFIHMLPASLSIHPHTTYPVHAPFTHPHKDQYTSLSTNQMLPTHPPIHQIVYPLPTHILVYLPIHPPVYPSRHHPSRTSPSIHLPTPTPQPAPPSGSAHHCDGRRHLVQYWHHDNGESA